MAELLASNEDGTPNYDCKVVVDHLDDGTPITRATIRGLMRELFAEFSGDVLLYFSGHGYLSDTGGVLVSTDGSPDDWGVPMEEVVQRARESVARQVVIIVDSCHAGDAANMPIYAAGGGSPLAVLREDLTVIAASGRAEVAVEAGGVGVFTAALVDALEGGAADHMGWVTAPAAYAYAERRFGAWEQRPTFKMNATQVPVLRQCAPLVERMKLRLLAKVFETRDSKLFLDPEFEPEDEHGNVVEPVNGEKVELARLLKDYRDAGLVRASQPGEQFYWVARRAHSVELTPRGREYWLLVSTGKI